jgi:phosphoglycerate dehydrogenase-like enzyme
MTHTPILILSSRAEAYRRLLAEALEGIPLLATTDPDQAGAQGAQCEVVLGDPGLLRHMLHRLPRLRWVQSTWAGVDALMQAGLRRDYILTNVRDVFGPPLAEYVLCYVLMHERRGWQRRQAQEEGRWDPTPPGSIQGKVMGLLGVGSIGAYLARAVLPFGVRPLGYTRASEGCEAITRYYHGAELHAFAAACDYIVCTLPDTPASRHIVDAAFLAAMRPHALLINAGRGAAVDEAALVAALAQGQIGGAVLDVFAEEPLPPDHPLWRAPNAIITSHTAALSFPEQIAPLFADNYARWQAGLPLQHTVSFARGY